MSNAYANQNQRETCALELFNLEMKLQVITTAIRVAKDDGIATSKIKKIQQEKSKTTKAIATKTKQLLKIMTLSSNVQQVGDSRWYYVRHQCNDSLDTSLILLCLQEGCIELLFRDNREQPALSLGQIMAQLPMIENVRVIKEYNKTVLRNAVLMLKEHGLELSSDVSVIDEPVPEPVVVEVVVADHGIDVIEDNESPALVISYHACVRWIGRILGIKKDEQIEAYFRANAKKVKAEIYLAVSGLPLLWTDVDGIRYYLSNDNIMFVVGDESGKDTVITLYETDFGFSKEINNMIAKKQVEVLASLCKELEETEDKVLKVVERTESELTAVNAEIDSVKARLAYLQSEERRLNNQSTSAGAMLAMKQTEFNEEHSKLFKKWKRPN